MNEYAVPILPSRDIAETLYFYGRLGFTEGGGAPGSYVILTRGSIELHFWHDPSIDPLSTDFSCYLRVDDADALHASWAEVGVPSDPATGSRLVAPVDTDYGLREFALVDLSGNLLRIGSGASRGN